MAGGWRATARMVAAAAAATAVSRAADTIRRLLAEATPPPELDGPVSTPAPLTFLEPPVRLTATSSPDPAPRDDHVIAAQSDPPHEFGPAPVVTPSHGIGFRSEPRRAGPNAEMPVISRPSGTEPERPQPVAPTEPIGAPGSVHTAASIVEDLDEDPEIADDELADEAVDALADDPEPEPIGPTQPLIDEAAAQDIEDAIAEICSIESDEDPDTQPDLTAEVTEQEAVIREQIEPDRTADEPVILERPKKGKMKSAKAKARSQEAPRDEGKGKHRRHRSAISGTVRSSRGRGLRGMQVAVLDDLQKVVATAVTGSGGAFIVEELAAGTYRLTATDEVDGDFGAAWHDGSSFAKAAVLKVKDGKSRRKADVVLVSTADVDLDVDIGKKKAVVDIAVTDRATGTPAGGAVRVSTKLFSTELALSKGHASITLFGSAKGSPALSKKIEVDYLGTEHTEPASASAKLR